MGRQLAQDWAEAEIVAGERRLQFTASFGVAEAPPPTLAITAGEILRRSEEALDMAEASGRRLRVVLWPVRRPGRGLVELCRAGQTF